MRRFQLHRIEDVSGVSGNGIVAEGVAFSNDGPVALRWMSEWPTSVVFHDRGIASVEAVHGHGGRTKIVWLDHEPIPASKAATVRKRPVEVEAMQWDGTDEGASDVVAWVLASGGTATFHDASPAMSTPSYISIDTLEGPMRARAGWWIIRGVRGEFYPCDRESFANTYDIVVDPR